mmetsp:Transcript_60702/g.131533  ORF Transcript_60702/g.131533 Transcript_60702/m.131533 type:complete len:239 (+) Transcript_60702:788-1504(+)
MPERHGRWAANPELQRLSLLSREGLGLRERPRAENTHRRCTDTVHAGGALRSRGGHVRLGRCCPRSQRRRCARTVSSRPRQRAPSEASSPHRSSRSQERRQQRCRRSHPRSSVPSLGTRTGQARRAGDGRRGSGKTCKRAGRATGSCYNRRWRLRFHAAERPPFSCLGAVLIARSAGDWKLHSVRGAPGIPLPGIGTRTHRRRRGRRPRTAGRMAGLHRLGHCQRRSQSFALQGLSCR